MEGNFSDSGDITGDILQGNTVVGSFSGGIGVLENTVVDGGGTFELNEAFNHDLILECDGAETFNNPQFFLCIN